MILKTFLLNLFVIVLYLHPTVNFANSFKSNIHSDSLLENKKPPSLIAVVPQTFPPFYHTDEEGLPYGMAIEVMNEIDHYANYLTKFIVKKSWTEVFNSISNGEAHIIPNLGITEERRKKFFFTEPYVKSDIGVFTRTNNKIYKTSKLITTHAGVVENNIGKKIAKEYKTKSITTFSSIEHAYKALINNKIDAIIYPRTIARKNAQQLGIAHLIYDTNITLKTIQRAIAVDKRHPEIYKKLNRAIKDYKKTQAYSDTYTAWYGEDLNKLETKDLVLINITILIFSISFFIYFWKKNNLSKEATKKDKKKSILWILSLILILITSTTVIASITLLILYETSFNEQRQRLIDTTISRARLIESIARYDLSEYVKNNRIGSTAYERTLSQVINAHRKFRGFGKTGEFTMAKKDNEEINFILQQRHSIINLPKTIDFDSDLAAPMRLALLGHSGTIIGKDYRGETVLAAYEPVKILNLGIVAKIDLTEIRKPFIDSALYIFGIVILISFFGALLFFNIMIPIIKQIKDTEQRFHQLFRNNQSAALLINPKNARIIDANTAALNFYGYTLSELMTYNLSILYPGSSVEMNKQLMQAQSGENTIFITKHRIQTGEIRDVEALTSAVDIDNETIIHFVVTDITDKVHKEFEYKQLQKELEQTRKMDALGQLTGGISHDFNNMLGIIMGYTDLSRDKLNPNSDSKIIGYLDQVILASDRAKELISSMMIFSRTGENTNEVIDISPLVKQDIKMLRSIIPSSIEMVSHIDDDLPPVLIEPVKLQQLIMNLCVNARDAMFGQGTLSISLSLKNKTNSHCQICYEDISDKWVELSVTDTGSGMSSEVVQHLFEPFFTTKGKGKGTGMGMSVVHGIIKELNGHILIDTELNKGTTISILFKPVNKKAPKTYIKEEVNGIIASGKRILVVDDEESLVDLVSDTLELYGHKCERFSSSNKALAAFKKNPEKFDLIISDQTMPELTGLDMIKKIREINPKIPAIISTGYSDSINETIAEEHNILLLKKPVPKEILIKMTNKLLT